MRIKKERNSLIQSEIERAKTAFLEHLNKYKEQEGLSQKDLSLLLNNSQAFTSALLSGKENVSLEKMVEIMYLIGKRLNFYTEDIPAAQRIKQWNG